MYLYFLSFLFLIFEILKGGMYVTMYDVVRPTKNRAREDR